MRRIYSRSTAVLSSHVGEEIFLYDPAKERYFHLNNTAAAVWKSLAGPKTASEIASDLLELFEVDIETCSSSVEAVLHSLQGSALVVVSDAPPEQ